jgi:hypothetical protein
VPDPLTLEITADLSERGRFAARWSTPYAVLHQGFAAQALLPRALIALFARCRPGARPADV